MSDFVSSELWNVPTMWQGSFVKSVSVQELSGTTGVAV